MYYVRVYILVLLRSHNRAAACDVICLEDVCSTSGWQNYGTFIWQRNEIRLVFANQPCFDY